MTNNVRAERCGDFVNVLVPVGFCAAAITPDAADQLAAELTTHAQQIRQDAARAICETAGHIWWGYNAYTDVSREKKIHLRSCGRPHCDTEETLDGWLRFAYPTTP